MLLEHKKYNQDLKRFQPSQAEQLFTWLISRLHAENQISRRYFVLQFFSFIVISPISSPPPPLSLYLSLSLSLSLSLPLSLCLSVSLSLSLSHSLSVCQSICMSVCIPLSFHLSLPFRLYSSFPLSKLLKYNSLDMRKVLETWRKQL